MTTSYATLTTPVTQAQYLSQILATLAAQGFPVTAWQPGNAGRTLAVADATALADLRAVIADVARGGYLDTATGDWLTLLAAGLFDITRAPATYAIGDVTLSCVPTAGPYNVTAGALVVTDGTRRWRSTNTTTQVVPSSGSVVVEVRAESPGTAHNVSGLTLLLTPVSPALAGVTVTAASDWIAPSGTPEESDAALRARCRLRWSTLGRGATLEAYEYHALSAGVAAITRAQAVAGGGDGTVTVYVAQASGAATSPQVASVQTYLDGVCPATDTSTVTAATAVPIDVTATVYVAAASNSAANRTLATDAITAYIDALAMGNAVVDVARIGASIYSAAGIRDVDLSAPVYDTTITAGQVAAVGTISLTWVEV